MSYHKLLFILDLGSCGPVEILLPDLHRDLQLPEDQTFPHSVPAAHSEEQHQPDGHPVFRSH